MKRTRLVPTTWVACILASACNGDEHVVSIFVNGTESDGDDFVVVSVPSAGDRPYTEATLSLLDQSLAPLAVAFTSAGGGGVTVEPPALRLDAGEPATIRIYGDRASLAENDSQIQVRRATPDGAVVGVEDLTVIRGVKIGFRGTFGFVTENNNGFRASSQGLPFESCDGDPDPFIWRATPLPCEPVGTFNQLVIEESAAPRRWSAASGKRPDVAVQVWAIQSFGPTIDLSARDPEFPIGMQVAAPLGGSAANLFTDDCDGNPLTGDPNGREQGVEVVRAAELRFGDLFALAYRDDSPDTLSRIWTRFPTPATAAEVAADEEHVDAVLFADGDAGCSSSNLTFFASDGSFQCRGTQTVKELLLRSAGFRAMIRRAWANWTSRQMIVTPGSRASESFIARLFFGASSGDSGGSVEAFLQLTDFDWYTLVGRVEKGLVSTPGGIPTRFKEWPVSAGCPTPREPDLPGEDDPL